MRRRPGGRSESLWSSCSTASTASGYHFVIRVITGRMAAVADGVIPHEYYTAKMELRQGIHFQNIFQDQNGGDALCQQQGAECNGFLLSMY